MARTARWGKVVRRWLPVHAMCAGFALALVAVAAGRLVMPHIPYRANRSALLANKCFDNVLHKAESLENPSACWCSCDAVSETDMLEYMGRKNAICPDQTLERHRLSCFLMLKPPHELRDIKTILYIAPHSSSLRFMQKKFPTAKVLAGYKHVPGSFVPGGQMMDIDVTQLQFSDHSIDLIVCEHVLEHVPDDRRALSEFHRVLKPRGVALLQVPMGLRNKETIENIPGVVSEADRLKAYGQKDHVRKYGMDFFERVRSAGFMVYQVDSNAYYREHLPALIPFRLGFNDVAAWAVKKFVVGEQPSA